MEGDALLPSEIARLVLGYLKNTGCSQTYVSFLNESPHLKEYVSLLKQGTVYPTIVHGKSLEQMLQEYGRISLGIPNRQADEAICKKLDSLLERLACLEAAQNKDGAGHLANQTLQTVGKSENLRKKTKFTADSAHHQLTENSSRKAHSGCLRARPHAGFGVQVNSNVDSGISCHSRTTAINIDSSSPVLSKSDATKRLEISIGNDDDCDEDQASACRLQEWDMTPVPSSRSHLQMSFASTFNTSFPAGYKATGSSAKNRVIPSEDPGVSFNLPELIDTLRNNCDKDQRPDVSKGPNRQKEKCLLQQGQREAKPTTAVLPCLPDFDQLSCSHEETKSSSSSNSRKSNSSRAKSKERATQSSCPLTPPLKNTTQETEPDLRHASPRRKRQLPKRRSTSSDFPLSGRPQITPAQSGTVESCIANSNDSVMSQVSQGFVPCIEELCQNSRFAEKLAESINMVSQIRLGNKMSDTNVDKKSAKGVTEENNKSAGQTSSCTEKKSDNCSNMVDLMDQLLTQEDTISNIIDMTTNDPDFDALFNMFHFDKNEFIEKEYGIKVSSQSSKSQDLSFASLLDSSSQPNASFEISQPNKLATTETVAEMANRAVNATAVDTKDGESSITTVSDVPCAVTAQVSRTVATTPSTDSSARSLDGALDSNVVNAAVVDSNSHLIELVLPTADGSTVELVEVITVAADQPAVLPSTSVLQSVPSLNSAAGESLPKTVQSEANSGNTGAVLNAESDGCLQQDHLCGKSDADSAKDPNEKLMNAINQLNSALSQLNQAIQIQKVSDAKEDVTSSSESSCLLPKLPELPKSMVGELTHLQQQLLDLSHNGGLPREVERGSTKDASTITTSQAPPSLPLSTPACIDRTASKVNVNIRCQSTSEPKAKRKKQSRKRRPSESMSDEERAAKMTRKDSSTEDDSEDRLTTSLNQVKVVKQSQRSKERGARTEAGTKRKQTFVEPWKVDHKQDKRKFLGVIWKHGSTPVDKVIVSEESASLLVDNDTLPSFGQKQQNGTRADKNKQNVGGSASTLPELSAKDVVDVANSPGVASSVDASCLSLTCLSSHSLAAKTSVDQQPRTSQQQHNHCAENAHSNIQQQKAGSHVRMLNFGTMGPSEKPALNQKASDNGENPLIDTLLAPSMPDSFDFVFEKNKCSHERRNSRNANNTKCSNSPSKEAQQKFAEKKEETEVAKTLISLATLPVISRKEDEMSETCHEGAVRCEEKVAENKSENLFKEKLVQLPQQTKGFSALSREEPTAEYSVKEKCMQTAEESNVKAMENVESDSSRLPTPPVTASQNKSSNTCMARVLVTESSSANSEECTHSVRMRVATKPTSSEKRRHEENSGNVDPSGNQPEERTQENSLLHREVKTSLKDEQSQNSGNSLSRQQSCSGPSSSGVRNTPTKCGNSQFSASKVCSPKRTHILTKLVEQGMKLKSPKAEKTCRRLDDKNLTADGHKVKKLRKINTSSLMAKINLSDSNVEKILSKIHK